MAKKRMTYDEMLNEALDVNKPYDLPKGWVWVKANGITTIVGGGTPSTRQEEYYTNGEIPWITPADLSNYKKKYIKHGRRNITHIGLEKSSTRLLPPNTVLMSSRAPIGYVVISQNSLSTNQGFKSFLPSNCYVPLYLYFYIMYAKEIIQAMGSGTTFKEISGSKAGQIPIPLAPISEQQRIVDRIESLFEKLDKAKELIQEALDSFETRRAAILHKAFTGELTAKWREINKVTSVPKSVELDRFIVNIEAGKSFRCIERPPEHNEIGVAKVSAITWGEYDEQESKTCNNKDKINEKLFIKENDFIISRANTIDLVGACVIAKRVTKKIMLSDKTLRLILSDKIDSRFLYYYINSSIGKGEIRRLASGNQESMRNISQKNIKKIHFPYFSLEEQKEIADILDSIFEKEYRSKELLNSSNEIEIMKKAILAKAFRGELDTKCEDDEDAMRLVERICRERANN